MADKQVAPGVTQGADGSIKVDLLAYDSGQPHWLARRVPAKPAKARKARPPQHRPVTRNSGSADQSG